MSLQELISIADSYISNPEEIGTTFSVLIGLGLVSYSLYVGSSVIRDSLRSRRENRNQEIFEERNYLLKQKNYTPRPKKYLK